MPDEVKSAGKATEVATSFLKQYYPFLRPVSAARANGTWLVKIDVGILKKRIAEIKINAVTGGVTEYSVPEQEG